MAMIVPQLWFSHGYFYLCNNIQSLFIIYLYFISVTNTATITLKRIGTYGTVNIPWQIGYPSGQEPATGTLGNISPQTGTVTIPHGGETKDFSITVCIYSLVKI